MKYFDVESREIVTYEQLEKEFHEIWENDGEHDGWTVADYVKECTSKNGTLVPVYDVETIG